MVVEFPGAEAPTAAPKSPAISPLATEPRAFLPTDEAAAHLNRRPQTLRMWAALENGPLRPRRVGGRLAWPVAEIRALLGVTQ